MLNLLASFGAGYACRSTCGDIPCRTRLTQPGRPFKLSILVHSASLDAVNGPGLVQNQRPYIGVSVGDKIKETELGDWSKDRGQWIFREIITVEVREEDEVCVQVSTSSRYNLLVATVSVSSSRLGELCFPISAVFPRLRGEDRDAQGIVYVTPVIPFDILQEGRTMGRVYLSFETKMPPPSGKLSSHCEDFCGFSERNGLPRAGRAQVVEESSIVSDLDSTRSAFFKVVDTQGNPVNYRCAPPLSGVSTLSDN